jgi:hypothetical protein
MTMHKMPPVWHTGWIPPTALTAALVALIIAAVVTSVGRFLIGAFLRVFDPVKECFTRPQSSSSCFKRGWPDFVVGFAVLVEPSPIQERIGFDAGQPLALLGGQGYPLVQAVVLPHITHPSRLC